MKFWLRQEIEMNQRYGAVDALRKLADAIDEHELKHECAVEIEKLKISIVAEIEDNCVPLETL